MRRKFFVYLCLFATIFSGFIFTAKKVLAHEIRDNHHFIVNCSENYFAADFHESDPNEPNQRIKELAGRTGNFNAVFSKSNCSTILENIRIQRTRTSTLLEKNYRYSTPIKAAEQTTSEIHQLQLTEIHQDIIQRK